MLTLHVLVNWFGDGDGEKNPVYFYIVAQNITMFGKVCDPRNPAMGGQAISRLVTCRSREMMGPRGLICVLESTGESPRSLYLARVLSGCVEWFVLNSYVNSTGLLTKMQIPHVDFEFPRRLVPGSCRTYCRNKWGDILVLSPRKNRACF